MLFLRVVYRNIVMGRLIPYIVRAGIIFWTVALLVCAPQVRADDIGDLRTKADSWIAKSKEIYRLDCDDMKQIWTAYCSEYDVTQERDRDAAREIADKMKGSVKDDIERQLNEYDGFKSAAEQFKTGDTESAAGKILDDIKTEFDRLTKLKSGAWLGSNHPLTQFAINYGIDKHKSMGGDSQYSCDVVDRDFSGKRPDCISAAKCMVYEFKPDNDRAKAKGRDQLFDSSKGDYVRRVNDYYSDVINKKEAPDSDYGGSDIKEKIHSNKSCYDGDWPDGGDPNGEIKTKFDGKVETYAACENTYECINP